MLEEKSSVAAVGSEAAPKSSIAPPGGALPSPAADGEPFPMAASADTPTCSQFTLQYLIAAIKKITK